MSLDLRPSLLDDLGLASALRWYIDRLAQRTGIKAEFVAEPFATRPPEDLETTCFRVTQEALTNTVRYAKAEHTRVELRQTTDELALEICDDGVGFDVQAARERARQGTSLGVLSMQERVELVGGQFVIESAPGHGTKVYVRLPLDARRAGESIVERKERVQ
jgi:signal transduction histidine kinase